MTRLRLAFIFECLLFFVPLNIYGIGDNLANGVQWALFRYQQSYLGNSLITLHRDLFYVIDGVLKGTTAYSTGIWFFGALLLVAALILLAFAVMQGKTCLVKPAGLLTITGGLLFLAAMLVQYGVTLHSDHGFSLPIGVPLIVVTGGWLACGEFCDEGKDTGDDGEDGDNGNNEDNVDNGDNRDNGDDVDDGDNVDAKKP
ncbi:hypothetical protein [Methanoregula sp.]|jgi:hypothetical protein|uniref:hypothetical protein n=1 Tax=Methanoregula sp. TaxID=2052170 RepID=UPI0035632A60